MAGWSSLVVGWLGEGGRKIVVVVKRKLGVVWEFFREYCFCNVC